MEQYSVLMSVYHKEIPNNLRASLDSMLKQTAKADEIVLVCDGPLTEELDSVIETFCEEYPNLFKVIRLEKNEGLGNALSVGVMHCTNEFVARMDSDDISAPDRIEKQLALFDEKPHVGLVSGQIEEFDNKTGKAIAIRNVPCEHEEIYRLAKHRCPVNHVACMFKKSEILSAGNYRGVSHEDYDLWTRMLVNGTVFENLPDILVYVRVGRSMYGRRGGLDYYKGAKMLEKNMLDMGFITRAQYSMNIFERFVGAIVPSGVRSVLYKVLMRKPPQCANIKSAEELAVK